MIKLVFGYEDLLKNCYEQEIFVFVEVTNECDYEYGGYKFYIKYQKALPIFWLERKYAFYKFLKLKCIIFSDYKYNI